MKPSPEQPAPKIVDTKPIETRTARLNRRLYAKRGQRSVVVSLLIVLLVCLVALTVSCGNNDDEVVDTSAWNDLVDTTWAVTAMEGFTADRYADAYFGLSLDRFGYYDGVNWKNSKIVWTDSGFTVTVSGSSTDVGAMVDDERYLHELVETGVQVEITRNHDGTLTLTQGKRSVTAERIA